MAQPQNAHIGQHFWYRRDSCHAFFPCLSRQESKDGSRMPSFQQGRAEPSVLRPNRPMRPPPSSGFPFDFSAVQCVEPSCCLHSLGVLSTLSCFEFLQLESAVGRFRKGTCSRMSARAHLWDSNPEWPAVFSFEVAWALHPFVQLVSRVQDVHDGKRTSLRRIALCFLAACRCLV